MADGVLNRHLAEHYGLNRETVRYWRACWLELAPSLEEAESAHVDDARLRDVLRAGLSNRERGGAPVTFPRHELVIGDAPNNARTPR
jgi:transposase-like protein